MSDTVTSNRSRVLVQDSESGRVSPKRKLAPRISAQKIAEAAAELISSEPIRLTNIELLDVGKLPVKFDGEWLFSTLNVQVKDFYDHGLPSLCVEGYATFNGSLYNTHNSEHKTHLRDIPFHVSGEIPRRLTIRAREGIKKSKDNAHNLAVAA